MFVFVKITAYDGIYYLGIDCSVQNAMMNCHNKTFRCRMLHQRADGTFLVRESTNFPGDYTLSMAYRGKVEHYRIYQSGGQITCDNEEFFANLTQLVSHYKRDADGLCHRLVTPIICENYHIPSTSDNIEDRTSAFLKAGLVIPSGEIRLGDIIGHGEFGGGIMRRICNDCGVTWNSYIQTPFQMCS
ncbi:unnamed protein product [Strongylus vulgaris]|uniref:SH2 domain-containing protein n=1 Tax=Strongylus vulgaris TaxID=40348 RepID=A0A3P7JNH8_STRVU|nr:unnamed protein product [Strongylus vulgaris]